MASPDLNPLQFYSRELIKLFQKSISHRDPATFLYKNKARTILFMAESLARLLNDIEQNKKTGRALKSFKKPEDSLGEIEDYNNFHKQFSRNKSIKKAEQDYIVKKGNQAAEKLNKKLIKNDFYQDILNDLITHKINFNHTALITKIEKLLKLEIKKAFDFYSQYPVKFTDLNSQVHELRRKLRWISIYTQSLQGLIVLKPSKVRHPWEKDFLLKKNLASPYNKVPVKKGLVKYIYFDQKSFYALNFTIGKIGEIKDKGLAIEALAKAIKKAGLPTHKNPTEEALKQLNLKYTEEDLFKEAHDLLKRFFVVHKIHENLI